MQKDREETTDINKTCQTIQYAPMGKMSMGREGALGYRIKGN